MSTKTTKLSQGRSSGRQKNNERHTPRWDAVLAQLEERFSVRGQRIRLAEYLADGEPSKVQTWAGYTHKITSRQIIPNAEKTLMILAWLEETRTD
jgi:hypothetical protein